MNACERTFHSWDGAELHYRVWNRKKARHAVILIHRGHEHAERWNDIVPQFEVGNCAYFAWHARGHGRSPGTRGAAGDFSDLVRDLESFVQHIHSTYGYSSADMMVVAQSVGAVIASAWVHDYAPPIRGLVLVSPAFRVRLYLPFAVPALRALNYFKKNAYIKSYVKGRLLTRDKAQQTAYDTDPLITQRIAVNVLIGLHDTSTRILADAQAIHCPVMVLSSGSDHVVQMAPQRTFFNSLPNECKEMHVYKGFRHDTFHEIDSDRVIQDSSRFMNDLFRCPRALPDLREIDSSRYCQTAIAGLSSPLGKNPKHLFYAATRLSLRTIGRLSRGVRLGLRHGFDSGAVLDYVYENRPRGFSPVGRWIDRTFLNAQGWRGIRQRRTCMTSMLKEAIGLVRSGQGDTHIVDFAAGHARYVLDAVEGQAASGLSVTLFDMCADNVQAIRRKVHDRHIRGVTASQSDAFDPRQIASASTPDIAVVSGLYELFPENGPVRESLGAIARVCRQGSYLVYTNQPWHPQLEFIARTLSSHRGGRAWIMRCRSQLEMDQLVSEAGFRKIRQLTDSDGMFTVSMAQRV